MKKILSFVLVLAISITTISSLSFSASAVDNCPKEYQEFEDWLAFDIFKTGDIRWVGNFKCGFSSEGQNTIFICDSREKGDVLTIPEKITYNSKEYTVNAFFAAKEVFVHDGYGNTIATVDTSYMERTFKKIVLPDTVEYVDITALGTQEYPIELCCGKNIRYIDKCYDRKSKYNNFAFVNITIPEGSKYLTVENNLILSVDKTKIYDTIGNYKTYKIPETVTKVIGYKLSEYYYAIHGFSNTKSVESITIPKTAQLFNLGGFSSCDDLKEICFEPRDSKLILIGFYASNNKIDKLGIPSFIDFKNSNFSGLTNVKSVKFNKDYNCKVLYKYMFSNYKSLKSITLPKSISIIGKNAFYYSGLEKFNFSRITSIKENAFSRTALKSIKLPRNVKTVGINAFSHNTNLKSVSIGKNAKLYKYAFSKCTNLKTIKLFAKKSSLLKKDSLKSIPKTCKLYVTTKAMKNPVKKAGFKGKIIVKKNLKF